MRYIIEVKQSPEGDALALVKLSSSKNNSPTHYKTKRIALKHLNDLADRIEKFSAYFNQIG